MDGVLSDMVSRYVDLYGKTPYQCRDAAEYRKNWGDFISGNNFETLPKMHDCDRLLKFLDHIIETNSAQVLILSSTASLGSHAQLQKQKLNWLKDNNINYPAIMVPGRRFKAAFATDNSYLIDDTLSNVDDFKAAGGHAVRHLNATHTIDAVTAFLAK